MKRAAVEEERSDERLHIPFYEPSNMSEGACQYVEMPIAVRRRQP